jgi:hypothetical protein
MSHSFTNSREKKGAETEYKKNGLMLAKELSRSN